MDVPTFNSVVSKYLQQNTDHDLFLYVDIGIHHLAPTVFPFPKDIVQLLDKVKNHFADLCCLSPSQFIQRVTAEHVLKFYQAIATATINISTLKHSIVHLSECTLDHESRELADHCGHLFQEVPVFQQCKRLGVERQPILGFTDITNLMKREYSKKVVLIHPCSVQKMSGTFGKDAEERKLMATVESTQYIPATVDPELHRVIDSVAIANNPGHYRVLPAEPRVHDRGDSAILAKFDIHTNLLPRWIQIWFAAQQTLTFSTAKIKSHHFNKLSTSTTNTVERHHPYKKFKPCSESLNDSHGEKAQLDWYFAAYRHKPKIK